MESQIFIDKELLNRLRHEYRITYLIYHRNKNQHKAAVWWKHLNILKRNVNLTLDVLEKLVYRKGVWHDKEVVKLHSVIGSFLKRHRKRMYYQFNGVIALGQFVTLGVVLISLLARIGNIYSTLYDLLGEEFTRIGCGKVEKNDLLPCNEGKLPGLLSDAAGEELGEEVGEVVLEAEHAAIESGIIPVKSERPTPIGSSSNKKRKKKKKKSAIDDLFG